MRGSGLNIRDHVAKTVAYYVKRNLDPQLAELAAYREIALRNNDIRVCEGCRMPHGHRNQDNNVECCRACETIVKCKNCPAVNPPTCPSCDTHWCRRHVACCQRSVCKHCIASCNGCAADIWHECVHSVDSYADVILEYCKGCS